MFKSMTAYGRACVVTPVGRFSVEVQSVNRKHLEINTFLPKELLRFDADIKRWVAATVGRGQVNVKIGVVFEGTSPVTVTPNLPLARQVKAAWEAIGESLGISCPSEALFRALSKEPEILFYDQDIHEEHLYREALHKTVEEALVRVVEMKCNEGAALHDDIAKRFDKLSDWIEIIAKKSPTATDRYRQRLLEKIHEVMTPGVEIDERVMREVCVYAEKIDIAEELTRFRSHLKQVGDILAVPQGSDSQGVGKPLEFLVQELNREINTISSKSSDTDVTRLVIDVKTELERIREQIQNIE